MSGSGNIYRHEYEDVAHRLVWGTVHEFLPVLRIMAETELAADGHSNRNIAGLLQISIKAVEWHQHQSYRKLDIKGRAQLEAALAG